MIVLIIFKKNDIRIGNTELIGDLFKECNPMDKSKHNLCK